MNRFGFLGCVLMMILTSCGGNKQPQSPPDVKPQSLPKSSPQKAPSNVPQTHSQGNPDNPAPPAGAQFTIFCARVEGDMHVQRAVKLKSELIAATGMKDWYVIHDAAQSLLYYGYYRTISETTDKKEAVRAQTDRQKIDLMSDPMGNRPFRQALFVELSAPDPTAPPEWNLANAKGAYSLQIAAYKDSPQRKEAAVEAVRAARAQGIQAYYYHGESSSLVCIGAWPEDAIRKEEDKAESRDPNQPIMVAPDVPLGSEELAALRKSNIKLVQPKVHIVDSTLRAAMQQYPHNAVNGEVRRRVVNGKEVFDSSLLVPIPHSAPSALVAEPAGPQAQPAGDAAYQPVLPRQAPPPPAQPGVGRLRSIGG